MTVWIINFVTLNSNVAICYFVKRFLSLATLVDLRELI